MSTAIIRERRQITLPSELCRELNISTGDALEVEVRDGGLFLAPARKAALDALAEIRRLFQESGITEKELLATARRVRRQLTHERYGHLKKA
jgi:AbrB family looped-hinge helix DNA binding protein